MGHVALQFYDNLIFYWDWLCIPANDRSTRETLLATYYDDRNHFGDRKTRAAITEDYFWPGITNDVDAYLRSCDSCMCKKSTTQVPAGFLHPLPVPMARFLEIALDFVALLPMLKSGNYLVSRLWEQGLSRMRCPGGGLLDTLASYL